MSKVNFSHVLRAAAHKGEQRQVIVDSVRDAAAAYAFNAGAKNLIMSVIDACQTTEKGKARTPAAGTVAALILGAMQTILTEGDTHAARATKGDTRTVEARRALSDEYGATAAERFEAAWTEATLDRDEKRETAKQAKAKAAALAGGRNADEVHTVTAAEGLARLFAMSETALQILCAERTDEARRVVAILSAELVAIDERRAAAAAAAAADVVASAAVSKAKRSRKGSAGKGSAGKATQAPQTALGAAMAEALA